MKKNLMPSASVWRMPHGPARFGPMRFCMSPMTLRSNQIINMVATSSSTNDDDDLDDDDERRRRPVVDRFDEERIAHGQRRLRLDADVGDRLRRRR